MGAGIAGLQMGALLSSIKPVIVLEKSRAIGGRARVIEQEGFLLDWGGHPVRYGSNSSLAKSMQEIGTPVNFIKPGAVRALLADGTIDYYPSGIGSIFRAKWVKKIALVKLFLKILKFSPQEVEALYTVSLQQWLDDQKGLDPTVIRYLKMVSASVMVCPAIDRVSMGEMVESMRTILKFGSVFYPEGGWTSFFNPMIEKIKKSGGQVRLNTKVSKIIVKNGAVVGVKCGDEMISAKAVISTVPVQELFEILDSDQTTPEFVEKCKNIRPTAGIAIDFCLSHPVTNITGIMILEDPPGFGFSPSLLSPELAPPGKQWLTFFAPVDIEIMKDLPKRETIHQQLKATIIKFFPDIEKYLEFERPLYIEMVDGVEVNKDQHRKARPGNDVPNIKDLWITGDSVGGEGAGGDVGHTSVRACFEKIKKSF